MERGDGGLDRVRRRPRFAERLFRQRPAFADLFLVPARAVLFLEEDDFPVGPQARVPAGVVEEHQGEETAGLRAIGHQRAEDAREANRLGAQLPPHERVAGSRGVPLVEDQVDDGENGVEALRQDVVRRHAVGNPGFADLLFGPHEPLRHRRRGEQKGAPDLLRRESAERFQGQRDLRFRSERRMAAREDEPQAVVRDRALRPVFRVRRLSVLLERGELCELRPLLLEALSAAQAVDGLVAGGRNEPCPGVGRRSRARPLFEGGGEAVLHRLLGQVEVAKQADQGREDPPGLLAVDRFDIHGRPASLTHRAAAERGRG